MNLFGLEEMGEKEMERAKNMVYFKRINDAHHFLERLPKLRSDLVNAWGD